MNGVKLLGPEVNHSPLSSGEVKNLWSYTSIPLYSIREWTGANLCGLLNDKGKRYIYLPLYYQHLKQAHGTVYSREFPFRIATGAQIILSQDSRGFFLNLPGK